MKLKNVKKKQQQQQSNIKIKRKIEIYLFCYFGRCPRRVFVYWLWSLSSMCILYCIVRRSPANMLQGTFGRVVLKIEIEFLLKPLSLINEQPKYD